MCGGYMATSEVKLRAIAENAKLVYLLNVFTAELAKESEDLSAIELKFNEVKNVLNIGLVPLISEMTRIS